MAYRVTRGSNSILSKLFMVSGFLYLLMGLQPLPAIADTDEAAFESAKEYTVKIRTRVQIPFFGDKKGTSTGAGFVADVKRGWIVTNAHVAASSPSVIKVSFHNSEFKKVKKLYVDPYIDIAVLEIPPAARPNKMTSAAMDCADIPAVGHAVGAFGHPWDLSFTGTRGIISGMTSKLSGMGEMLQTDAPINPGNSGGPLISLRTGKVVGVNTASHRSGQNTNFAVPMSHVCRILDLLREGQDPSPPELPFVFYRDLDEAHKLVVAKTFPDQTSLDLKEGDIIHEFVGVPEEIRNKGQLIHTLRGRLNNIALKVTRGKDDIIVLGSIEAIKPVNDRWGVFVSGILFSGNPWKHLGGFMDAVPDLVVHHVESGSVGESQKIEVMDMLLSVDGRSIQDLNELHRYLEDAKLQKREVMLKLIRISDPEESVFSYIERPLDINALRVIGKQS